MYNIAEINAYVFIKMAKKNQNQILSIQLKDFKALNIIDLMRARENPINVKLIVNIVVIIVNDYNKFFYKLYRKYISLSKLRKRILYQYYNYINIQNLI